MAAISAIETALVRNCHSLWLECDSLLVIHAPRMTDDDSEEDIEREEKFYLEEKVDSKEKKAHAEESVNMFEKIKPKMTEDDSEEDKQTEEKFTLKKKEVEGKEKEG
ncbi:hypothetical protein GLYMA_13G188700v4 [Glycine max]|nr:hypothetical protein GLYMA_13G188700v4 [Glycine max]KAH1102245.1 hypothetical protein GYH30_036676 [Glycine max]